MLSVIHTAYCVGINATPVRVEVDVRGSGMPKWKMVGMLETAIKESRERVESALHNSGYIIPNRKTTVSLHPAGHKKGGAHFDLSIAIALLAAWEGKKYDIRYLIAGELSLTGKLLPTPSILLLALAAKDMGLKGVVIPAANVREASLVPDIEIIGASSLREAAEFVLRNVPAPQIEITETVSAPSYIPDMSEVRGQFAARRGLEVAASGGHHVLMLGPPGAGKSMLAERLSSILPPLTSNEELEILKIMSAIGNKLTIPPPRPFRAPHHSASYAGLIGGGAGNPSLGEISLAHKGVLFLDEMGEFRRDVLEMIRQPLESGEIRISRAGASVRMPAQFLLIAATNPCRCGYLGHPRIPCTCTLSQIHAYRSRLSGPMLDRIDIQLELPPIDHSALWDKEGETSASIRQRVIKARQIQHARYNDHITNAELRSKEVSEHCPLGMKEKKLIVLASERLALSARAVTRLLKVSRTIADLEGSEQLQSHHIEEALSYRAFDRLGTGERCL